MNDKPLNWPPIISGARRPTWMLWRDIAITLFMWGVFLVLVEIEFAIVGGELAGISIETGGVGFEEIRGELRPAVWFIALLVAVLGFSTLLSRRRRARALLQPQPSPAEDEVLARDLGISEQSLETLRRQKIIALDLNACGTVSGREVYVIVAKQRNP